MENTPITHYDIYDRTVVTRHFCLCVQRDVANAADPTNVIVHKKSLYAHGAIPVRYMVVSLVGGWISQHNAQEQNSAVCCVPFLVKHEFSHERWQVSWFGALGQHKEVAKE